MATPIMINSKHNGNVIDIEDNSTKPGALLDAFPPKAQLSLTGPTTLAANQTWEVLPDPAGSHHFIIKNPATGNCVAIKDNSTARGASLEANTQKDKDNQDQLWDFIPDPFGSSYSFIQNPQTGYVIGIEDGSSKAGASLVVDPRRLFDNNFQLWSDVQPVSDGPPFPALTLAQPTAVLKGAANYVLLPVDQSKNLTGIVVTLDIIDDLVADSFSVQINGNPPYPFPKGVAVDVQWMQWGLVMQNNSLVLFTQVYPVGKPAPGDPLPSKDEFSGAMLSLKDNTVPAGTRIVMTLTIDSKNDEYVTGVIGKVFDKSGAAIGTTVNWQTVGQPTFHGGPVTESILAPLGAFQVVVVGAPGGHAHFTSGMGTISVTCTPDISAQLYWPYPPGGGTGESSNCYYGKVQEGYSHQIVQPFGLPHPKMTSVLGDWTFAGTGLLPNSKLTGKASYTPSGSEPSVSVNVFNSDGLTSQSDGSFSVMVEPTDTSIEYKPGSLTLVVTDADKNWASGSVPTDLPGNETTLTSSSGLAP